MKLYEIPIELENYIDPETGEITDVEAFESLVRRFDNGREYLALMYKNYRSDAEQLEAEERIFKQRKQTAKNKAESIKKYLDFLCAGQKFSTDKCSITYRKSVSTEVDPEFVSLAVGDEILERFLKFKEPEVDTSAIKEAIKSGMQFDHARLVEKNNIQIK